MAGSSDHGPAADAQSLLGQSGPGVGATDGVGMGGGRARQLLDGAAVVAAAIGAVAPVRRSSGCRRRRCSAGCSPGWSAPSPFRRRIAVPARAMTAAQAVVGVAMGALIDLETLRAVAANWLPVLLVTVGTLALSLAAGQALRLQPGISPVTGAFAMIAGGASGIIVMARELGADERMVAVLQYLRVLLIVVLMPVVATTLYGASPGLGTGRRRRRSGLAGGPAVHRRAAASSGSCWAGWSRLPVPPCSARCCWPPPST